MRSFPFRDHGQLLNISVLSVDEGWELWILDGERRLGYGGRVTVDEAIESWRRGEDSVQVLAEEVKSQVLTGRLVLDPKMPQPHLTGAQAAPPAKVLPNKGRARRGSDRHRVLGVRGAGRYIPYNSQHDCPRER